MKKIIALLLTIILLNSAFAFAEEIYTGMPICTHRGQQEYTIERTEGEWITSINGHTKICEETFVKLCADCYALYQDNETFKSELESYKRTITLEETPHTFNSDHVCTVCEYACTHIWKGKYILDYDIVGYQPMNMVGHKICYNILEACVHRLCRICGEESFDKYNPVLEGAYAYEMGNVIDQYLPGAEKHHFVNNVCTECGYEKIDGDPDCVHSFVKEYDEKPQGDVLEYRWDGKDTEEHEAYYAYPTKTVQKNYCRKCGYVDSYVTNYDNSMYAWVKEPHDFVNGVCGCGYKKAIAPTTEPTTEPTAEPTAEPTTEPTVEPTAEPTEVPTVAPTQEPSAEPTVEPTAEPTEVPTVEPTEEPTAAPTMPTVTDTPVEPTAEPSAVPSEAPKTEATKKPSSNKKTTESETKSEAVVTKTFRNDWAETVFSAEVNDALKALDEINPEAHESMLVLLAVMGFEDQVGDLLSEEALIVKAQMEESLAAMTDEEREKTMIEGFEYETIIVNDQTYSIPTFEWIVTENDIVTVEFYALRWNGTAWTLEQIEASEETVCAVQTALNALDYNCGEVDGICGPKTKAALMAFQKDNALLETGVPTHETLQKLRAMNCEVE